MLFRLRRVVGVVIWLRSRRSEGWCLDLVSVRVLALLLAQDTLMSYKNILIASDVEMHLDH